MLRDNANLPVDGAVVSYLVIDAAGATVLSHACADAGSGRYQDAFPVDSLGKSGPFTVAVSATKSGYLGSPSSASFTVEPALTVGHDVELIGPSWAADSGINPADNLRCITPGQPIHIHGIRVANCGDYREENFPIRFELWNINEAGAETTLATYRQTTFSLDVGQTDWCPDDLYIPTDGLKGNYVLKLRTALSGDAHPDNDWQSWMIVIGNPNPGSTQLPYASFDWYKFQYQGVSTTSPSYPTISSFTQLKVQYIESTTVQVLDGGRIIGQLTKGIPAWFATDGVIMYLDGCEDLGASSNPRYLVNVFIGKRNDRFAETELKKIAFAYPDSTKDYRNIPSRYVGYFDYYVPAGIGNSSDAFEVGWGPKLSSSTLNTYCHEWTSIKQPDGTSNERGNYGGSLQTASTRDTAPGTQNDFYVFVPSASMPEGDYSFLIVQESTANVPVNGIASREWHTLSGSLWNRDMI